MSQSNTWATAQEPRFVSGPVAQHTAPALKAQEAEDLAAAVNAHIAAGGRYEKLAPPPLSDRARRAIGDQIDSED